MKYLNRIVSVVKSAEYNTCVGLFNTFLLWSLGQTADPLI